MVVAGGGAGDGGHSRRQQQAAMAWQQGAAAAAVEAALAAAVVAGGSGGDSWLWRAAEPSDCVFVLITAVPTGLSMKIDTALYNNEYVIGLRGNLS